MHKQAFGHPQVSILSGGLPAWLAAGLPVASSSSTDPALAISLAFFTPASLGDASRDQGPGVTVYEIPEAQEGFIKSYENVVDNCKASAVERAVVLDARPAARYVSATRTPCFEIRD